MGGNNSKNNNGQNEELLEMNNVFKVPQIEQDEEKNQKYQSKIIQPGISQNVKKQETIIQQNLQGQQEQTSCLMRIVTIIIILITLGESIFSTYISYYAYNGFKNLSDQLKTEVTDRYALRMISDIKSDRSCSGEYEAMFIYIFQGTNTRCDCRKDKTSNINNNDGEITIGFCQSNQEKCKQINTLQQQVLSLYPFGLENKLNKQLCYKTYSQNTFQSIKNWPKKCEAGFKQCGGQNIESMTCMPENELCPINSMILSQKNPDPDIYNENLIFNSTHTLYYSRKSDNLPLNYAYVTSGEGPCYDMKKQNTYKGRIDHYSFKEQREYCQNDKRWQRLAEIGEYTYFKSNDIKPEEFFKDIYENYKITDDYRYGFYISHYPPWKYEKRNLLDTITIFVEKRDFIMQYQTFLLGFSAGSLVFNVIIGIKIIRLYMINADKQIKEKFEKKKNIFCNIVKILQIGACIFQIVTILNYVNAFNECVEFQVSDKRNNSILKNVGRYLNQKVFIADKKLIASNCVGFLIALLLLAKNYYDNYKNRKL